MTQSNNTTSALPADINEGYVPPSPSLSPGSSPRKISKTFLVSVFLMIVLAVGVGVGVLYVSNPQKLADIRSLAGKNNAFTQGGKWKIEEGCKGSGCVHDPSVNEARNAIEKINSGAQSATVTLPNGSVSTVTNETQAIEALKDTYIQIHDRAPNVDFTDVSKNPQNLALPYVSGGYTLAELQTFYAGVDYTKPENFNRAGYAQLGVKDGDPVSGYYYQSGHYYPVEVSQTDKEKESEPPPLQCIRVLVYDATGTTAFTSTDLAALKVGDTITLGFTPSGSATKVQFKVNTGDWHETTTKVGTEFRWTYTLENLTSFNITAQWFDGTAWH